MFSIDLEFGPTTMCHSVTESNYKERLTYDLSPFKVEWTIACYLSFENTKTEYIIYQLDLRITIKEIYFPLLYICFLSFEYLRYA